MNREKLNYIEEAGLLFEKLGMTRMVGRVFACIMVSDRDQIAFEEVRKTLGASKGSISTSTRQLVQIGLIEPVSLPGDRKTYFRVTQVDLGRLLRERLRMFSELSEIFARAREVKQRDDEVSDWLREAAGFYGWVDRQIDQVIDRWHRDKESLLNNDNG